MARRLRPAEAIATAVMVLSLGAAFLMDFWIDVLEPRTTVGLVTDRAQTCSDDRCSVVTTIRVTIDGETYRFESSLDAEPLSAVRVAFDSDNPTDTLRVYNRNSLRWRAALLLLLPGLGAWILFRSRRGLRPPDPADVATD